MCTDPSTQHVTLRNTVTVGYRYQKMRLEFEVRLPKPSLHAYGLIYSEWHPESSTSLITYLQGKWKQEKDDGSVLTLLS